MAWAKIDDKFYDNPKVRKAGKEATCLYLSGLVYSSNQLTEGFISDAALGLVAYKGFVENEQTYASVLVDCGLWDQVEGGYIIHDYLEYNPTKEEIEEARARKSAAGKKGAHARWQDDGKQIADAMPIACGMDANAMRNGCDYDGINPSLSFKGLKEVVGTTFFEPAKLFQAITGMAAIPGTQLDKVLPALETLWYQHDKDADGLVAYLKPFYDAWTKRKSKNGTHYSKSNCSWLYDWAVAGEIPPEYIQPEAEKPRMRKLRGADGEIIEVPA